MFLVFASKNCYRKENCKHRNNRSVTHKIGRSKKVLLGFTVPRNRISRKLSRQSKDKELLPAHFLHSFVQELCSASFLFVRGAS